MIVDVLLCLSLVYIAFKIVTTTVLFEAIVYFIAFGMMLAIAWAKLNATDLALAEIALGSGITGALLLETYAFLKSKTLR
jgi:uncharacterized MnhB-related membrane protein